MSESAELTGQWEMKKKLLLVEFIAVDRFIRGIIFPFIKGLLRGQCEEVLWIRFGLKASVQFARSESGIGLNSEDTSYLKNCINEFNPSHIIFNHKPSEELIKSLKKTLDGRVAGVVDGGFSMENNIIKSVCSSIADINTFLGIENEKIKNLNLFETVEPDFGWIAGNELARVANPLPFIMCGVECTYNRSIKSNSYYKDVLISECPSPYGCAFCMRDKKAKPWRTDPLKLAVRQLEQVKKTHPPFLKRPQIRMDGQQIFFKIMEFAEQLKELDFPSSDFLFDTRADNLIKRRMDLIHSLEYLKGTGHRIHLCLIGIENFSDRELERMNKGITADENIEAVKLLLRLEKDFPDTFCFREHGGLSMIMFTPWTTLDDLYINLSIIEKYDLHELSGKYFTSRVRLYKELPFYFLAKHDGLIIEKYDDPLFDTAKRNFYPEEIPWCFKDVSVKNVCRIMIRFEKDDTIVNDPLYNKIQSLIKFCSKKDLIKVAKKLVEGRRYSYVDELIEKILLGLNKHVSLDENYRRGDACVAPTYKDKFSHVDIKITSVCNNCCIHCIEFDDRERQERIGRSYESKTPELINRINEFKRDGGKILTLTGGEPTLRKDLPEIIRFATSIGIFTGLQTNARLLSYPDYAKKLALPDVHFVVAVHGHNKKIHDSITRVDGSFEQTLKGVLNLLNLNCSLSINTVISKKNMYHLKDIIIEFTKIGVKKFNFVFPRAKGNALLYFDEVIVRYSDIKDELLSILQDFSKLEEDSDKPPYSIRFENIPPCILNGRIDLIKDYVLKNIKSQSRSATLEERNWSLDRILEIKTKISKCSSCKYFETCEGILKEYIEKFGDSEF